MIMKNILILPFLIGWLAASAQLDTCIMKHTINGVVYTTIAAPLQLKSCMGLNNVSNTSDANKPISTAEQAALNLKTNVSDTAAMLAGYSRSTHTHAATTLTGILPFAQGGISGATAPPATTGTMTINMTASIITITPTGACTFNASSGVAGQICTFYVTTSGTTSFTLTWGTNFHTTATLATGTTTAKIFTVTFVCLNSTTWTEISRTAAQS